MRKQLLIPGLVLALFQAGCASGGMFVSAHVTDVGLNKNNYTVVARNVAGEASSGYVLGFSMPMGMAASTFALFRVSGTGQLYKDAMENLWENVEKSCGALGTRKLALVNVRYDAEALNLLLYTQPKITIRADVVEFDQ